MHQKMKKNILFLSLSLLFAGISYAQKTIIINGGQFGNPLENVNVSIYDTQTKTSTVIDTIHTSSVQDILIDGDFAYVTAQDSIVKYNLSTQTRVAANAFNGVSTKTLVLSNNNELIVGNWYGKTSDNIYFYDQTSLALVDSISAVQEGAKSIYTNGAVAFVTQNEQTLAFEDTSGYILSIRSAFRAIVDTLRIPNYTGDIGEIIPFSNGMGFYTINSVSNTIATFNFGPSSPFTPTSVSLLNSTEDLKVGNRSQYSIYEDTIFMKMNSGIGAYTLSNLTLIDPLIVDTVVTAFAYDTLNFQFYVTQTDFFSYSKGQSFNRNGNSQDIIPVGFSPEVVRMYYDNAVGLSESESDKGKVAIYPNPSSGLFKVTGVNLKNAVVSIFDQQGKLVNQSTSDTNTLRINLIGMEKGIYFIQIIKEGQVFTDKIILQ